MPRGNGKKNHSVNKERSHVARKKIRKWKLAKAQFQKRQRTIKEATRAYWRGEGDYPVID